MSRTCPRDYSAARDFATRALACMPCHMPASCRNGQKLCTLSCHCCMGHTAHSCQWVEKRISAQTLLWAPHVENGAVCAEAVFRWCPLMVFACMQSRHHAVHLSRAWCKKHVHQQLSGPTMRIVCTCARTHCKSLHCHREMLPIVFKRMRDGSMLNVSKTLQRLMARDA